MQSLDKPRARPTPGSPHDGRAATSARFCARPWGGYEVLEEGAEYKVKRLVVEPGHRLSLQRHRHRAEYWVVVAGAPRVIVSRRTLRLKPRGTVVVPRGAWHRIENPGKTAVVIIEVQQGAYLGEDDIVRRHDDYGRVGGAADRGSTRRARR
jgi:mannose-6-phosphate isomerase-like protein (cupin superfamily)